MNFSKIPIGVKVALDKVHFTSWTQIKKYHFYGLSSHQEKITKK